uniref:Vpu protein n=1 Tax=Human immunodeficiency virus type 1 TaxID=11676 RepID=A0A140ED26_HV1|nr:vpu protein [Human immunodeficiency virus 1]
MQHGLTRLEKRGRVGAMLILSLIARFRALMEYMRSRVPLQLTPSGIIKIVRERAEETADDGDGDTEELVMGEDMGHRIFLDADDL